MCPQSCIREQLADLGRECENWVICTEGLEAQRSLPLLSTGSQCLWAEWSQSYHWFCENTRWELSSADTTLIYNILVFILFKTISFIFFVCASAFRYPSHQSGCGPSSDPKGAGRCGHPPAQPHHSLLLICPGAVDSEYILIRETIIVTFSFY